MKESERFSRGSVFACQSHWRWITDDFSLVGSKRFKAGEQTRHQRGPEYPTGQLGRRGYARNRVGQEIICHRSSDINKDGWCVAISFHCTTSEPLREPLKSMGVFAPEEQRHGSRIQCQKWKMQRDSEESWNLQTSAKRDVQNTVFSSEGNIQQEQHQNSDLKRQLKIIKKILVFKHRLAAAVLPL